MISHMTLGSNDLPKAKRFFESLLPAIGGKQIHASDSAVFFEFEGHETKLAIMSPYDQAQASVGNGAMVALKLNSIEQVDRTYHHAISLGASSEGAPGLRNEGAFYGAYFRDLDGNKFALFTRD